MIDSLPKLSTSQEKDRSTPWRCASFRGGCGIGSFFEKPNIPTIYTNSDKDCPDTDIYLAAVFAQFWTNTLFMRLTFFLLLLGCIGIAEAQTPVKPPANFISTVAVVNDMKIHYVKGGKGEALLLLHGLSAKAGV